jgi:hypothetical protein
MYMQALAIFRPAGGIVRPHQAAQLLSADIRAPLYGIENSLLDRRQTQSGWRNDLLTVRANVGGLTHTLTIPTD